MIVSEKLYQSILENLSEGIYYVDKDRSITYWNKAAENITGYTKEEVMGKSCADNLLRHIDEEGNELCITSCPLNDAVKNGDTKEKSIYLHHKDGHRLHVFTRVAPITGDDGKIVGAVEMFHDLSTNTHGELICELEKLKEEVYTDSLTNIGNRKYASISMERRLSEWTEVGIPFSIFFIDIDDFKRINDTYGHDTGDKVLKMVAKSITGTLRAMDVACRWGGEEFIVISPNLTGKTTEQVGERIRQFVEKSWIKTDEGEDLYVTISVGCTVVTENDTEGSVIKRADTAMYRSKLDGKNRVTKL
jgi:diguanylate cyclase (GGDEF)-like protein/PAS domain S-box-containing protein